MKKKIVIHIENFTAPQEVVLQHLLQAFCVDQIEVLEDTTSTLLIGNLQIDVQRHQVWRAGSLIELTPMEFDILHHWPAAQGRYFQLGRSTSLWPRILQRAAGPGLAIWFISCAVKSEVRSSGR